MKRKCILLLTSFFSLFLLAGCWSKTELNDLAIATAMAIDKAEDGYLVSVQVLNPSQIASQQTMMTTETAVTTYHSSGGTILEALRELTKEIPGKLYLAHIRIVIFGEEVAREGIRKPLDFLSRDYEFRTDFYILVSRYGMASPLLNVLTSLERIPANSIFTTLQMSQTRWAPTKGVTLDELIENLVKLGQDPVLTGIYVKGEEQAGNSIKNIELVDPPAVLKVDNLAAFHGDRLIDWLNNEESMGYIYVLGNVRSTIEHIPCDKDDNGKVTIEIMQSTPEVKAKVVKGEPKVGIKVKAEGNVADVECLIDLTDPKKIQELQETIEKTIEEKIEKVVEKAKNDLQSDILGFGEAIHRSNPKLWKKLKNEWKEHFPTISHTTKVEVKIRRFGTITDSFQEESED
ncbi:Ger(x)C family spore germination protein [Pueribacillus theae]|uniref:Ger(x)C family spore germination protein n=1 Tax=Pueribacillus theae TaxID=2171751 RepID=UPI001402261D|nr:Ger(x)C family spore germination protein [Pueribacillus theae]